MLKRAKRVLALALVMTFMMASAVYAAPEFFYIEDNYGVLSRYSVRDMTGNEAYKLSFLQALQNAMDGREVLVEDDAVGLKSFTLDGWKDASDNYDVWKNQAPQTNDPPSYDKMIPNEPNPPIPFPVGKTLKSIDVSTPAKTEYKDGENLDLSALVVTMTYDDGSAPVSVPFANFERVGLTETPANGTKLTVADDGKDITVTYTDGLSGIVGTLTVSSETPDKEVTNVAVIEQPALMEYTEGEALLLEGLVVELTYSDGTTEPVSYAEFTSKGLVAVPDNGTALTVADDGTLVTVTHTVSGYNADTDALTVKAVLPEVTEIFAINSNSVLVNFTNAPATTLSIADFILKAGQTNTPSTVVTPVEINSTVDGKSYILTTTSRLDNGNYISVEPGSSKKFVADTAVSTAQYDSKYVPTEVELVSDTVIKLSYNAGNFSTALTNQDLKRFIVVYNQTAPTSDKGYHIVSVSSITSTVADKDHPELTIPSLIGTEGEIYVNGVKGQVNKTAPTITNPLTIRTGATTATFTATSDKAGSAKYILDNTGIANAPTAAEIEASGTSWSDLQAGTAKTLDLTGLIDGAPANLYIVYADTNGNKTEVQPYKIQAEVQADNAIREVEEGDTVGTFNTNSAQFDAVLIISDEELPRPNKDSAMPTEEDYPGLVVKKVAVGVSFTGIEGVVGQYVNIFESKGTTEADKVLVDKFTATKLTNENLKTPGVVTVTTNQMVQSGKTIDVTAISPANIEGCKVYALAGQDAPPDAFDITKAILLGYSATATIATPPSDIADGNYYVYLYHEASKTSSTASSDYFMVNNKAPQIEIVANSLKYNTSTEAEFSVKVNSILARTAAASNQPIGIYGKIGPSGYVDPVAMVAQEITAAPTSITITLATSVIPTGSHGAGLELQTNAAQYISLQAIDQAGNKSDFIRTLLNKYVLPIPTTSYTIKTSMPSSGDSNIYLSADNKIYVSNSAGVYESGSANYDQVKAAIELLQGSGTAVEGNEFTVQDEDNKPVIGEITIKEATTITAPIVIPKDQVFTVDTATAAVLTLKSNSVITVQDGGTLVANLNPTASAGDPGRIHAESGAKVVVQGKNAILQFASPTSTLVAPATDAWISLNDLGEVEIVANANKASNYTLTKGKATINTVFSIGKGDSLTVNSGATLELKKEELVVEDGTFNAIGTLNFADATKAIKAIGDSAEVKIGGIPIVGKNGYFTNTTAEAAVILKKEVSGNVTANELLYDIEITGGNVTISNSFSLPADGKLNINTTDKATVATYAKITVGNGAQIIGTDDAGIQFGNVGTTGAKNFRATTDGSGGDAQPNTYYQYTATPGYWFKTSAPGSNQ